MANHRRPGRLRAASCAFLVITLEMFAGYLGVPKLVAQDPAAAAAAPADDSAAVNAGEISLNAAATGVRRYSPGRWSAVAIGGGNKTDQDATGTVAVYFGNETQHQFARQLWVPAHARRFTWLPVRVPLKVDDKRWSWDMNILPVVDSSGGEILKRREGDSLKRSVPLMADREGIKTGALFRRGQPDKRGFVADPDDDAYEMMAVARQATGATRVIIGFPDDFAPPHPVMWESLDQFILAGDQVVSDSAGLAALRSWLHGGGKLCVFLDRTSPETLAAIVGHGESVQVVDRVQLNEFSIKDVTYPGDAPRIDRRRFDRPVDLVRVLVENAEVHCEVNGWPAAFWLPAGYGEVLVITLGPAGWRPVDPHPGRMSDPENSHPEYRAIHALHSVASRFYASRPASPVLGDAAHPLLQEQIGYRIPSRRLAVFMLAGNLVLLVVGGVWLVRRQQLAHFAWLAPTLAVVTMVCFLVIGARNSRSIPASAVFAELVRYYPDIDAASVSGTAAVYQQETKNLDLAAGPMGLLQPAAKPTEGTLHRLMWRDDDSGSWLNVSSAAGSVQFATYTGDQLLPKHVAVEAQFTAEGLVGTLPPEVFQHAEDALIATLPAPALAIQPRPDGTFVGKTGDVLPLDQYLRTTVVSDESRRRQEVYRGLFKIGDGSVFLNSPTVFAWTRPKSAALRVPPDLADRGSALASVPLRILRTPAGTEFRVPATFIRTQSVHGPKGKSLAYNERRGRWITEASRATTTRLRFALPPAVLPCQLQDALLTIKLTAPSRSLIVTAVGGGKEELVREVQNPSGVLDIRLDRPEWLQLDSGGGLLLELVITPSENELKQAAPHSPGDVQPAVGNPGETSPQNKAPANESFSLWEISYVRLDVHGKTN